MSEEFTFEYFLETKSVELDELKKTELGRELVKKLEDFIEHFSTLSIVEKTAFDSSLGSEIQKSLQNLDNSLRNQNLTESTENTNDSISYYLLVILTIMIFFG